MAALSVVFDLIARDSASRQLRDVGDEADRTGGRMSKLGGLAKAAAVGGVATLGVALVTTFKGGLEELQGNETAMAQFVAGIKSTGGAAKVSAEQMQSLADSIEAKTGTDGAAVVSGGALLATFVKVRNEVGKGNDIFTRATQAGVDLAARGFGSVESNAVLLGKALNDPIKGLTALGKQGVTFTEGQKATIKSLVETGDTLGAQKIILAEIEGQVGGSAEAYGKTLPGQLARARAALEGVQESVVKGVLPALNAGLEFLTSKVIPGFSSFADMVGPAFAKAGEVVRVFTQALQYGGKGEFDGFLGAVNDLGATISEDILPAVQAFVGEMRDRLTPILERVGDFIRDNLQPILSVLTGALGGVLLSAVVALSTSLGGALLGALGAVVSALASPVIILGALAGALVHAYRTNEDFREFVQRAWANIKEAVGTAWTKTIRPALVDFAGYVRDTVIPTVTRLWRDVIVPAFKGIGEFVGATWNNVIKPILSALNTYIRDVLIPTSTWFWKNVWVPAFEGIAATIKFNWDFIVSPILKALNAFIREVVAPTVKWLWDTIVKPAFEGISAAVKAAWAILGPIFGSLRDTLKTIGDRVQTGKDRLDDFTNAMKAFKLPGWVKDLADFAGSIGSGLANAASRVTGGLFGDGPGVGGRDGDQPRGVKAMMAALPPGTRLISGLRPGAITATGNRSYHSMGRAVDLPPSMALFNYIKARFGAVSKELIFSPAGSGQIHNGRPHYYGEPTRSDHFDHVHWAMHQGGQVGVGIARSAGDGPTERTVRTQVGEVITTGADMRDLLAAVNGLREDFRRFPSATRDLVRAM